MRHKTLHKIALGLLPVLLLFLTAEIAQRVRYAVRDHSAQWLSFGSWNQWRNRPAPVPVIPIGRTPTLTVEPPDDEGEITILCIGGSSTYGAFNPRDQTYPHLLGVLLNDSAPSRRFQVLNRGLAGASVEDYHSALDRELALFTPDVVIFYTGYNNIFIKDVNRVYMTIQARLDRIWHRIGDYSLLAHTARERYLLWAAEQQRLGRSDHLVSLEQDFKNALDALVGPLTRNGVRVILIPEVLMARDFGGIGHNYERYAEQYVNIPPIIRDIATRHNAEFIDLQEDFDALDFTTTFADPVHLTDTGNRVLSRLIFERSTTLKQLLN